MPIISATAISPHRIGGKFDFRSYWATLISATVETAAPTHVVLTFPTAQPSLGATDFTITGFTISSASWTGSVLTLVLSEAVLVFDGNLTVTFVTTGETATVTNNVADDGNTVGWYLAQDTATVTRDENDLVSAWNDKLGSGHNLLQATPERQPVWSATGIEFNSDALQAAFDFNQPVFVYILIRQITWVNGSYIFDGKNKDACLVAQNVSTPSIASYAGSYSGNNTDLRVGSWGIVRALWSGANSKLQVNDFPAITGDFGNKNPGGFTIGMSGGFTYGARVECKEAILRKSTLNESEIYNYFNKNYSDIMPVVLILENGDTLITEDSNNLILE